MAFALDTFILATSIFSEERQTAIEKERERCARIVESQCGTGPELDEILTTIAAAIHEGVTED